MASEPVVATAEELEEGELSDDDEQDNKLDDNQINDNVQSAPAAVAAIAKPTVSASSDNHVKNSHRRSSSAANDSLVSDKFVGHVTDNNSDIIDGVGMNKQKYRSHHHRKSPKTKHEHNTDLDRLDKSAGSKHGKGHSHVNYGNIVGDFDDVDAVDYYSSSKWSADSRLRAKAPRGPYDSPEDSDPETDSVGTPYSGGQATRSQLPPPPTFGQHRSLSPASEPEELETCSRSDELDRRYSKSSGSSRRIPGIPRLMDVVVDRENAATVTGSKQDTDEEGGRFQGSRSRTRRGAAAVTAELSRKRKLVDTPMDERPYCRFFMDGKCAKGDDCAFNHDFEPPKKAELCRYYLSGNCTRGKTCVYYHGDWPCKNFHVRGNCSYGDECKFSHEELTELTQPLLEQMTSMDDEVTEPSPPKKLCIPEQNQPVPSTSTDRPEKRKIPSLLDIPVYSPGKAPNTLPPGAIPFSPDRNHCYGLDDDDGYYNDVDLRRQTMNYYGQESDEFYDIDEQQYDQHEDLEQDQGLPTEPANRQQQQQQQQQQDVDVKLSEVAVSETEPESLGGQPDLTFTTNTAAAAAAAAGADLSRLPPMQRELYLRIQKHQPHLHDEDNENTAVTVEPAVKTDDNNWYSSDEEDTGKINKATDHQFESPMPATYQPQSATMSNRPSLFNVPPPLLPPSMQSAPGGFMAPPFNMPLRNQCLPMRSTGPTHAGMQGMPAGIRGRGQGLLPTPGQGLPSQGFQPLGLPPCQGFPHRGFSGPGMPQGMSGPGPGMNGPGMSGSGMPGPGMSGNSMTGQGMPGPGMPEFGMTGPGMPGQGMSGQGMPEYGMIRPGMSGPGMPEHRMSGPGMPRPGIPGLGMPGIVISGPGIPTHGISGPGMPGPGMPTQGLPGHTMLGQGLPEQGIPGLGMPVQGIPGMGMSGMASTSLQGMPPTTGLNSGMPNQGLPPALGMTVPGMQSNAPAGPNQTVPMKFDIGHILSVIRNNSSQTTAEQSRDPRAADPRLRPASSQLTELPITCSSPPASPPPPTAMSPVHVEVNSVGRRVAYILRLVTVLTRPSIPTHVNVSELRERNDPRLQRYYSVATGNISKSSSPPHSNTLSESTRKIRSSPPPYSLPDIVLPPVGTLPPLKVDDVPPSESTTEWKQRQSVEQRSPSIPENLVKIPEALQERNYPVARPETALQRQSSTTSSGSETCTDKKIIDYRNDPRYKKKKTRSLSKEDEPNLSSPPSSNMVNISAVSRNGRTDESDIENFRSNYVSRHDDSPVTFMSPSIHGFNASSCDVDLPGGSRSSSDSDGQVTPPVHYAGSQLSSYLSLTAGNSTLNDESPQEEVSLKDMFKTIDPTTSPFC